MSGVPGGLIPPELVGRLTVDVPTAGRVLGLGRCASYEAARRGDLPTIRIGRRILVPVVPLLAMVGIDDQKITRQRGS